MGCELCPLLLGVSYLPPAGSADCPRDLDSWWAVLAADWAEGLAVGAPLLAMGLNAQTCVLPDEPAGDEGWVPRRSREPSTSVNRQHLLAFCHSSGARLCHGRMPGRTSDMATSFGVSTRFAQ